MTLICKIFGHKWRDTHLDRAIQERWGIFTCDRCNKPNSYPIGGLK